MIAMIKKCSRLKSNEDQIRIHIAKESELEKERCRKENGVGENGWQIEIQCNKKRCRAS